MQNSLLLLKNIIIFVQTYKLLNMTATDIYEHSEYFNPDFSFTNEYWIPIGRARFTRYKKSNYFRVKNEETNYIMKPSSNGRTKRFAIKLTDDNSKVWTVSMKELFDGFDVDTEYVKNGCSEFIMNAF
jgi:hypothetical protein